MLHRVGTGWSRGGRVTMVAMGLVVALACGWTLAPGTAAAGSAPAASRRVAGPPLRTVAPASGGIVFVSPRAGALITSRSARVVVRTAAHLRRFAATLDNRDVTRLFRTVAPGRRAAVLSRAVLRPGRRHLTVVTVDRSGRRSVGGLVLIVGRVSRRLLSVRIGAFTGSVPVELRLGAEPDLALAVKLNGRPVGAAFRAGLGLVRSGRLAADDGLRRGRNVLTALAARGDGQYRIVRRTIEVRGSEMLVAAGPDPRATVDRAVTLRGSISGLTAGPRSSHRWTVISAPGGSTARPATPSSLVTRFTPDRPGIYRLRLAVGRGSHVRYDVATVMTYPDIPPIGEPIDTIAQPYTNPGIELGTTFYPLNAAANNVVVLILDRQTLAVDYEHAFLGTAADAQTVSSEIAKFQTPLVIISDPLTAEGNNGINSAFAPIIKGIGANPVPLGEGRFSVVGVQGAPVGTAWQNDGENYTSPATVNGDLQGYLQIDSNENFTFVPSEHVPAELSATGSTAVHNVIQIGSATYPSGPLQSGGQSCTGGGFQVEALALENLAPYPDRSATFGTDGCQSVALDTSGVQALTSFLQGLAPEGGDGPLMVLVQSIGTPRNANVPASVWEQLDTAMQGVGATNGVVAGMGTTAATGSYSLIGSDAGGSFPLAESSSALTGEPAAETALLVRARSGHFEPQLSSYTGAFDFDLATLAYQPTTTTPETAGEQRALTYIAEHVLHLNTPTVGSACYVPPQPDVRSEYCDTKYYTSWGHFATELRRTPYPSGHGFSAGAWTNVSDQLAPPLNSTLSGTGEFESVQQVWSVINALDGRSSTNAVEVIADAQSAAAAISADLSTSSGSDAIGNWLGIFGDIANAGSAFSGNEELAEGLNYVSSAFYVGADTADLANGAPAVGRFDISAADFGSDLAASLGAAQSQLAQLGAIIVTDPGKLLAFRNGSQYGFNGTYVDKGIVLGADQFSWQSLLPAAYEAVHLGRQSVNSGVTNAAQYQCTVVGFGRNPSRQYNPFPSSPLSGQLLDTALYVLVQNGSTLPSDSPSEATPPTPAATLTDPLFEPYATNSSGAITQFNLFKPWFYREAFDLSAAPTVDC